MKDKVTIKDDKWVWPLIDENSWNGQNEFTEIAEKLLPHVKNKNIMIQAGGNCGFLLSKFVEHFNIIYTFEPDPINFYCLNQNVTSQNVIKMQACLGNVEKTVSIKHFPTDIGGVHVSGEGFIQTILIDNLNLPGCDLLQLDVEGYEINALLGAIETIKRYKPVLCIEFFEPWLNRYEGSFNKLEELISSLNYIQVEEYGVDKIFIYKNSILQI